MAIASMSVSAAPADQPTATQYRLATTSLPIATRAVRLGGFGDRRTVVTAIAMDPRGEFVAAAGDDQQIRILGTSNLQNIQTLTGHRDVIRTLAFDNSGQRLVSAGNDGQLIVWDRDESFRLAQRMQGTPALARVRFSPDGHEIAAVGFDNGVFLIGKKDTRKPIFECDCDDLRAVAYRDDNRALAIAGRSGELHVLDPADGKLLGEYPIHQGRINDVMFHHQSNSAVCVGDDGNVTVFETSDQQLLHRIPVTTGKLFAVAILTSQLVAVAGSDNVIRIVNTDEGFVGRTLQGHTGSVSTLAAGGGLLFSGSFDATLRRWTLGNVDSEGQRIAEGDPRIDR